MAVLVDTSVVVAFERGNLNPAEVIRGGEEYFISVVSAAELLHGVHRATGERALLRSSLVEAAISGFAPIPIDLAIARTYGRLSADLGRAGASVDANDLWIASTAVAMGLEVLALDGDFQRIPGVRLVAT